MQARTVTSGYSGTPLVKKLGIKGGTRLRGIALPPGYAEWIGPLPPKATFVSRLGPAVDIAHVFVTERTVLARELARLRAKLRSDAAVWISWPKRAAKVPTDISEDAIRAVALPLGFVDIKVCAVTDVWSGLKLVVRRELR
jgi:hypothetical protein